jgi:predicted ATPase
MRRLRCSSSAGRALLGEFSPTDADAQEIAEICRRLDGIPLAIELAVPTLQALPLSELRERLEPLVRPADDGPPERPCRDSRR